MFFRGEAGGVGRDEETADAVFGLGPDHGHVRYGAHPGPALAAVYYPLRALWFPPGKGLHVDRVAAGVRLGEAEAPDGFPGGHLREPLVLLVFGAPLVDRRHRERTLHADEGPEAGVAGFELHAGETVGHGALAGAAVPGKVHAEQPEFSHLGDDLPREVGRLPPLFDVRLDPAPHKGPDLVPDRKLLFR